MAASITASGLIYLVPPLLIEQQSWSHSKDKNRLQVFGVVSFDSRPLIISILLQPLLLVHCVFNLPLEQDATAGTLVEAEELVRFRLYC